MSRKISGQIDRPFEELSLLSPNRAPTQCAQDTSSNPSSALDLVGQVNAKDEDLKMALREIIKDIPKFAANPWVR
jgi:hypothetical protein